MTTEFRLSRRGFVIGTASLSAAAVLTGSVKRTV